MEKINESFDKVSKAAKQFEQTCEGLETFMLPDKLKEKVENMMYSSSRLVNSDKILMKNVRSVFSGGQVHKKSKHTKNEENQICEMCGKMFSSVFMMKQHHCRSKWACLTCNRDMYSQYNLLKHNQKPCEKYTCLKCQKWFYKIKEFRTHKDNCTVCTCKICSEEFENLHDRRKHMRKQHRK